MHKFKLKDLQTKGTIDFSEKGGGYDAATSTASHESDSNPGRARSEVEIEGDSCGTIIDLDKISQGQKGYVNFRIENTRGGGGDPINLNMGVLADPLTFIGSGGVAADLVNLATDNADCDDELGVGCPKFSAWVRRILQGKNLIVTRLKVITNNDAQRAESLNIIAADLNTNRCNVIGRNPLNWTTNIGYTQRIVAGLDATHGLTYALLADIGPIDFEVEYMGIQVNSFKSPDGDC